MSAKMTKTKQRRSWRKIVTWVTVVALVVFCFALRHQIADTIDNLTHINLWFVAMIIPIEMLNYHSQTRLYQGLFAILEKHIPYRFMYRVALELNFVNNLFPSGGVSGFSYFSLRMHDKDVSTAKASLVQLMKLVMVFVSFQVLLGLGLIMLAIGGSASNMVMLIAGSIATLLLVGTLAIAFIVGSEKRIDAFFTFVTVWINKLVHTVRRNHPETINVTKARQAFKELHENYMHIRRNWGLLRKPVLYGILANLAEVAAIYVVYVAFGLWVNPGAVILAYAIANFAGLISVLPGGVGIYEVLMTTVLAAAGIPPAVSLPVTVTYRVVNMAVQMPVGYYFYQDALHHGTNNQQPAAD